MEQLTGYIGTYDSPQSFGVYRFTLNTENGEISAPQLYYRASNAKCVALYGKQLAFTVERNGQAGIYLMDTGRSKQASPDEAFYEEQTACYIEHQKVFIYTANYHAGTVFIYQKGPSLKLIKKIEIAPKAGCHQILLHQNLLLVPCLNLDAIHLYDIANHFAPTGKILFPSGSGPRHGVFARKHERFFVVSEHSNQVFSFCTNANFTLEQTVSILPPDLSVPSASAAIRLSPDERFLYVSTRGADLLTVFGLDGGMPEPLQQVSCGGNHPRDFLIAPNGHFLLVVNRFSNDLISFRIDKATGRLEKICAKVPIPEGIGIALETLQ